jgi:hypothetical protein
VTNYHDASWGYHIAQGDVLSYTSDEGMLDTQEIISYNRETGLTIKRYAGGTVEASTSTPHGGLTAIWYELAANAEEAIAVITGDPGHEGPDSTWKDVACGASTAYVESLMNAFSLGVTGMVDRANGMINSAREKPVETLGLSFAPTMVPAAIAASIDAVRDIVEVVRSNPGYYAGYLGYKAGEVADFSAANKVGP